MAAQQLAQGLASLGRNGDSVLVHMQPHEVAGLQALAEANGTSLSINPHTGLPEAFSLGGFFKSLLPTIAGGAVGAAGGPLALGLLAGAATGAITNKEDPLMGAVMGGLGGYGGFGLGGKLGAMGAQGNAGVALSDMGAGIGDKFVPAASSNATMGVQIPENAFNNAIANAGGNIADEVLRDSTMQGLTAARGAGVSLTPQQAQSAFTPNVAPSGIQRAGQNLADLATMKPGAWDAFQAAGGSAMDLAMPLGGAALEAFGPEEELTLDEQKKRAGDVYDPYASLDLSGDTGLRLNSDTGLRLFASGGPVSFDDGGVPGSKLGLRREDEPMQEGIAALAAPMPQVQTPQVATNPNQPVGQPETTLSIDIVKDKGPVAEGYAARAADEGVAGLMQENAGQGVDFRKLYGGQFSQAPMAPQAMRGFGPDGKMYADGGSVTQGGLYDLYASGDQGYGGNQLSRNGYGIGRLEQLTDAAAADRAKYQGFSQGGTPTLEDGGFVVPADVVFYAGGHSTAEGQKKLAQKYGAVPIRGPGNGLSDDIPTSIEGKHPARVADGEAYIPKEKVERHGGAKKFYKMMDKVRKQATGSKKQAKPAKV